MKRKLVFFCLILTLVALLLTAACAPAAPAQEQINLTLNSGDPGGSWYPTAISLAAIWETNIPGLSFTHIPGGGAANVLAVNEKKADVAITNSISVGDGVLGNPPFEKKLPDMRSVGAFLGDTYNFVVFADSDIFELTDLKGKRISPAKKGWTAETVANKMLEAVGLSYDDMSRVEFVPGNEAIQLMRDGHIDAATPAFDLSGDPGLTELTVFKPIRILPVPDDVLKAMQAKNPGVLGVVIPAGSYPGVDADVAGVGGVTGLIASPDLSEELVYQMTKAMAENWVSHMQPVLADLKKVEPQGLARLMGVDFHPGALKYYREQGWVQ
jgi:TRAP transporter TAXI family solute receptor